MTTVITNELWINSAYKLIIMIIINKLWISTVPYRKTGGFVTTTIDHNKHRVFSNRHYVLVVNGYGQNGASVISMAWGDHRAARVNVTSVAVVAACYETATFQVSAQHSWCQSAKRHTALLTLVNTTWLGYWNVWRSRWQILQPCSSKRQSRASAIPVWSN